MDIDLVTFKPKTAAEVIFVCHDWNKMQEFSFFFGQFYVKLNLQFSVLLLRSDFR